MRNKKVWVVSEVFYPDETSTAYIMTAIAERLGKEADVHVLCGPEGYGDIISKRNLLTNVTIHRLKAFNLDKNNILFRLLRLLFLSLGMFLFGLFKVKRRDKLLLVTNPALSIPLFSFLKILKGFQFFILVHDVFPENLIPAGILRSKKNIIYRFLKYIFNSSYKKADKLFVLGRDMAEIMTLKVGNKAKVRTIENWADSININAHAFSDNSIVKKHSLQNKIVFLFAGNLGRLQGLSLFFEVISEISNDELHFLFIGNGAMLSELQTMKKDKQLENVSFLGTFPRNEQSNFLNASHFGLVSLEDEVYGLGVPSKSYNILAAGKPIFFIGNQQSEIARLINESRCGISFGTGDKAKIINFLNQLNHNNLSSFMELGIMGRKIIEERYSKEAILERFKKEIIDED